MLTNHQQGQMTFTREDITKDTLKPLIIKICLNIIYLKFHLNLPGANGLNSGYAYITKTGEAVISVINNHNLKDKGFINTFSAKLHKHGTLY